MDNVIDIRAELFGPGNYSYIWDWVDAISDQWPAFLFEIDLWLKTSSQPLDLLPTDAGLAALESLEKLEAACGGKLPPVVWGVVVAVRVMTADGRYLHDGAVCFDVPEKLVPEGVINFRH